MKHAKHLVIFFAVLTTVFFVGCNKNDSDSRSARSNTQLTGNGNLPTSGYYTPVEVAITGSEQAAKDFLMPNVSGDGSQIGSISAGNVKMKAYVVINRQNNQVVNQQSYILITVADSISINNNQPPFQIGLPAKAGTVNGSSVDITFGDSYGDVHLVAALNNVNNQSQMTGRIDYSNKAPYQSNGTLGQFTIQTCGFFDCGK